MLRFSASTQKNDCANLTFCEWNGQSSSNSITCTGTVPRGSEDTFHASHSTAATRFCRQNCPVCKLKAMPRNIAYWRWHGHRQHTLKGCGRPQQRWHHVACGVACVLLMCAEAPECPVKGKVGIHGG